MAVNPRDLSLIEIAQQLAVQVDNLRWQTPSHVYNPLRYAWRNHERYLQEYGIKRGRILLVGMNPGPWGMAQTGVPFGDVEIVRDWFEFNEPLSGPLPVQHPKYPVLGMECRRREGSGQRVWGWAQSRFKTPDAFFERAFIWNYCPLLFLQKDRNLVPEKLNKTERIALTKVCDQALQQVVQTLAPKEVVGIGRYAEQRLRDVLGAKAQITYLLHPSPANPRANRSWDEHADALFRLNQTDL